jgi:hypothetical protein
MNNEEDITTVTDLARLIVKMMASKEDLIGLATKNDLADLATKTDLKRVENKLDAVIDRTIPDHDRRISRVEKILKLPNIA